MMAKNRCVFLFGAGATLTWGSPLTSELTELILDSGFKIKGEEKTITRFIYETLLDNAYRLEDVNFETIINVIEELIVFYGSFNYNSHRQQILPSLISCFFSPSFEENILNFSIKGGEIKHGYQLQIPEGIDYPFSSYSFHNESPQQFYFQHLLNKLLTAIGTRISNYAYHTSGHSTIKTDAKISDLFSNWMAKLEPDNILRLYTLNYERIFKILLERRGIPIFEGFDSGECIEYSSRIRADVKKIFSDENSNIHYNLHGSVYWKVLNLDQDQLPNPEIILTAGPSLSVNIGPASFQVEKGKTLLLSNIITGYQKAQKTMITPFKQMQAAFDKDCSFADQIYIIGYSLGDEHINESIKTAIRHNPAVKITIIDPYFIKNNMDYELALKFYPFRQAGNLSPKKISDNLYSYMDGKVIVHTLGFEDFLALQVQN